MSQRILMIANEMNRASKMQSRDDNRSRRLAYERVLRLVDLTATTSDRPARTRELLRWRDLVAAMFVANQPDPGRHREAFRALLLLDPVAAKQIPFVLG